MRVIGRLAMRRKCDAASCAPESLSARWGGFVGGGRGHPRQITAALTSACPPPFCYDVSSSPRAEGEGGGGGVDRDPAKNTTLFISGAGSSRVERQNNTLTLTMKTASRRFHQQCEHPRDPQRANATARCR